MVHWPSPPVFHATPHGYARIVQLAFSDGASAATDRGPFEVDLATGKWTSRLTQWRPVHPLNFDTDHKDERLISFGSESGRISECVVREVLAYIR